MSKFKENLKVPLTEEEISEASEKLAKLHGDIEQKDAEKKNVASRFKADIEALQGEARRNASLVRDKYDYRMVECEEVEDPNKGTITVIRLDTGEVVRARAMTADELQQRLNLDPEEAEEDEGDADTDSDSDTEDPEDDAE